MKLIKCNFFRHLQIYEADNIKMVALSIRLPQRK